MSKGYPIIGIGIISFIFGLIFDLQGQSIVGPESSFMYANPDWITYGIQIMVGGIIMIGIGIVLKILKK
jgi:mannose/fructose/N-acetylgalactosamine-specific phosphotransferase system component IIC